MKAKLTIITLFLSLSFAYAGDKTYWYCVQNPNKGTYKVKVQYRGVDLGKEAGKLIVVDKTRAFFGDQISVSDYNQNTCGNSPELDIIVSKNIDGKIAESILSGDPSAVGGAIMQSIDATVYEIKEVVKNPTNIVKKPVKEAERTYKKIRKKLKL